MVGTQPLMLPVPTVIVKAEAKAAAKAALTRKTLVDGECVVLVVTVSTGEFVAYVTLVALI